MLRSKLPGRLVIIATAATALPTCASAQLAAQSIPNASPPAAVYDVSVAGLARLADANVGAMLPATIVAIIDGDTASIAIADPPPGIMPAEKLRLRGIDAPEKDAPDPTAGLAAEAFLANLVAGRTIYLAFDFQRRDRFGRLLAHAYLGDGTSVEARMIESGHARHYHDPLTHFYDDLQRLERQAAGATGIAIDRICNSGKAEHVVVRNLSAETTANLVGWRIRDAAGHELRIADELRLPPGAALLLLSGSGASGAVPQTACHYERAAEPLPPLQLRLSATSIWNNDGDQALLFDRSGRLVETFSYP
jgi:endonuclease YncB( thermonuclease family)